MVVPPNGIKGLRDVQLPEKGGGLGSVEFPSEVPHIEKVVVDAPFLDKGTLAWRDEFINEWRKA